MLDALLLQASISGKYKVTVPKLPHTHTFPFSNPPTVEVFASLLVLILTTLPMKFQPGAKLGLTTGHNLLFC